MDFTSDNVTGAAPEILRALADASEGTAPPYGADSWTERLTRRVSDLFETPVEVYPVVTGTAANALALGQLCPPFGAVFCHEDSHINTDECGAPEMFTAGAKLVGIPGPGGKLHPDALDAAIRRTGFRKVHRVRPAVVSLTQATECGTLYAPDEIAAIAEVCRRYDLRLHMDGARFAKAAVALGCAPADITWRVGVDVLSLGATKNGAWAAEAVVFLRPGLSEDVEERRKRAGHLVSKGRFVAAQLVAYLDDDLWRRNASHANAMARRLGDGLSTLSGVLLPDPVEANMAFPVLPDAVREGLRAAGYAFYDWPSDTPGTVRLVTHFATRRADVDALIATARGLLAASA
ncbi:threonine aldolase family protein [Roseospira marina]|uniref:threonine aldolase family protein n=1 Tax=Roseospira marina TaxID=140057 RepID=UPI0014793C89|nr:low specificity L-threonine aldolase [Roseospira marina]MBB4312421.1 threonine aldolase [Roseospira marina]MBB5085563.1 threonine aldolase [Roseospira marina]